jgi:uncharacterized membrane protein YkoI
VYRSFTYGSEGLGQSGTMKLGIYILMAFFLVASVAQAQPDFASNRSVFAQRLTGEQARNACKSGDVMCARKALRIVKKRYPNLRHSTTYLKRGTSGQREYVVKMMSRDGHIVEVRVDARSGRVLGSRGY